MGFKMKDLSKDKSMKGILLVSDVDGTLVTNKGVIPERNIAAIDRFIEKGGRFVFATGRSVMGTLKFAARVPLNAPYIVYNGGGIYDYQTKTMLWNKYLAPSSVQIIKEVKSLFPDVGIEVYSGQHVYTVNENEHTKAHVVFGGLQDYQKTVEGIPENLNKILLCCDSDRLKEVAAHLDKFDHHGCTYVFSGPIYFEVLPEGVSKGETVKILADMLSISHDKIMGIGDYYNDLELIKTAAIGAVPANAPDDLKRIADVVVGPCENGAVADFIEYLEAKFESTPLR